MIGIVVDEVIETIYSRIWYSIFIDKSVMAYINAYKENDKWINLSLSLLTYTLSGLKDFESL